MNAKISSRFCRSMSAVSLRAATTGGDYRGDTSPQHFGWGERKGKCPPTDCQFSKIVFLVSRHFSGSLQNAYLGEELKGFCIIKIQFLFSFWGLCPSDPLTRGFAPGPRWGLRTPTPTIQKKLPPLYPSQPSTS